VATEDWQPMPRAADAFGAREKLEAYCLNADHEVGRFKAASFEKSLGIGIANAEYLAGALRAGIREIGVGDVRLNAPYGVLCEVRVPVRGIGKHRDRVVVVITAWELRDARDRPRLVTAYIGG
jgi:hypothetical protein